VTVELRRLDRGSEAEVRAYWQVMWDAVLDRPYHQNAAWQAASTYLRAPRRDQHEVRVGAWQDGRMVGAAALLAPELENTDTADVFVDVLPEARRRGVGTALLADLERVAAELGRSGLRGWAYAPVGAESAATRFATHHGFRVDLEEGSKVLDLTSGRGRWAAMADEAAEHHGGYRVVTVWAPIPDELMDGYCRLSTAFMGEIPAGDAPVDLERWDAARVRDRERRTGGAGRRDAHTFALDAAGEAVALTELYVDSRVPHRAFQGGTLVMPGHRGHRLGLAVKLANLRALVAAQPGVEWIRTDNADVNAPMNAINDQLGFRVVERCVELRRELHRG
jgi:GNAT superfamily N-acetyltransferase